MAEKLRTYNDLLKLIQDSEREYDLALIDKAYQLAYQMHGDQKRLSGAPYISHPIAVACILVEMGMDSESVAAGLLHDVVEDTPVDLERDPQTFWQGSRQSDRRRDETRQDSVFLPGRTAGGKCAENADRYGRTISASSSSSWPTACTTCAPLQFHVSAETARQSAGEHGSLCADRAPSWYPQWSKRSWRISPCAIWTRSLTRRLRAALAMRRGEREAFIEQ